MTDRVTRRFVGDLPVGNAESAAEHIEDDATVLMSGFGSVGYPKVVPRALAESDRDLSLTVLTGGSTGHEVDSLLVEAGAIARRYPYQSRDESRNAANENRMAFQDYHISRFADDAMLGPLRDACTAVVEAVAVGEDWLIPSTSLGHTRSYVEHASELIVEVNEQQPLALQSFHDIARVPPPPRTEPITLMRADERIGDAKICFDRKKLLAVVRSDVRDTPYEFRDPTQCDRSISTNFATFLEQEAVRNPTLEDKIHIQFGVGSLGNALANTFTSVQFDQNVIYYGEVVQDGLLDLLDEGVLRAATGTSLALSESGQDRLFCDSERYAEDIILRPADISNRAELIDRFGLVSVNTALEVDLYGHANSTHLNGTDILNSIGGSGDFARNALVSVMALGSTAKNGNVSRIVPMVSHVDHTEHDLDVIITEQGAADLRGLAPRERARKLIENCAHPSFRTELKSYLEDAERNGGHLPHDLEGALTWSDQ